MMSWQSSELLFGANLPLASLPLRTAWLCLDWYLYFYLKDEGERQ